MEIGVSGNLNFNPRPPRGGRQLEQLREHGVYGISIHAPREGGDGGTGSEACQEKNFNPRPPRGGRQPERGTAPDPAQISIHAPREGGDDDHLVPPAVRNISIHAPREGGDCITEHWPVAVKHFNPRPPRGGRRAGNGGEGGQADFNPRPPRGGRHSCPFPSLRVRQISIHAPREGGDTRYNRGTMFWAIFQSTPPARGATSSLFRFL